MSKSDTHTAPRYDVPGGKAEDKMVLALADIVLELRKIHNELVEVKESLKSIPAAITKPEYRDQTRP